MSNSLRTAEAGDICILLYPEADERMQLRSEQERLVTHFGGWVVPEPHITMQRFRINRGQRAATETLVADRFRPLDLSSVIDTTQQALSRLAPFPIYAAGLTEFLAPFWGTYVIRWEIQRDHYWNQLVQTLDEALTEAGCGLHYHHEVTPTCSAVDLTYQIKIDEASPFAFPHELFTARRLVFSGILGMNDFETLGMVKIGL